MPGHRSQLLLAVIFLAITSSVEIRAEEIPLDPLTGLIMAQDWELVRNNCIACHSSKLITQQSGSREQWLSMIRWMQAKQNLWQFQPDTEEKIIVYLAENYPPKTDQRRAALPADQMPPNPYAADVTYGQP